MRPRNPTEEAHRCLQLDLSPEKAPAQPTPEKTGPMSSGSHCRVSSGPGPQGSHAEWTPQGFQCDTLIVVKPPSLESPCSLLQFTPTRSLIDTSSGEGTIGPFPSV